MPKLKNSNATFSNIVYFYKIFHAHVLSYAQIQFYCFHFSNILLGMLRYFYCNIIHKWENFLLGIRISNVEALADVIFFGWTEAKYKKMLKKSKQRNAQTHPSWHKVGKAKAKCIPANIDLQERCAKVSMKDALYHQISKILLEEDLVNRMKNLLEKNPSLKFELIYKYGADGSSSYAHYRNAKNDTKIFASNLVPIFIIATDEVTGESENLWANYFANSAYGVVPLRWAFEEESTGKHIELHF